MPPHAPVDPTIAELAHDLRIACMRVARRVRFDADTVVPPHLFSILARLVAQPRTVGELAAMERVSAPTMSRAVAQLTDQGYVVRSADEHDGRLVRLSLTPEGSTLVTEERANRDAWMAERLEGLSAKDQTLLRRATDLIEEILSREATR